MRRALFMSLLLAATQAFADARAWDFRVFLGEREIGRHRFTLSGQGAERELRSEARFDVRILLIPAYRYRHEALERWRGDCLVSLSATTDDNGDPSAVDWRGQAGACDMSFAYWNPRMLQARRLLNAQTGEVVPVTVTAQGEETVQVRGRPVLAQRHRLHSLAGPKLAIDLWYAGGEWVALQSTTEGGRVLRYRLM
ncbi:MAG: DUF6134 family protein [Betaproteobacteria bacterium]